MDGIDKVGFENESEKVQNQKENAKNEPLDVVEDSVGSELCGWKSCTPDALQNFASARWLLCVLCLFAFIQNMVTNGFVNVSITTLERRFDLSSSHVAIISGCYDIAAGLGVVPVSYYCANRHKGRALTAGLILYGFGALLFSSPHFFAPKYSYGDGINSSQTFCSVSDGSDDSGGVRGDEGQDLSNYLYIFIVAQLMMGTAATPLYTIGIAYLDENVKHKVIGGYIGIFLMVAILGAAFGFVAGGIILNTIYVNGILESSPTDVPSGEWMGAWWPGFFIGAIVSFLAVIPMSCFPAHLPGYNEITKEKLKASRTKGDKEDDILVSRTDFGKWKDFPSATWHLVKNSTYMFISIGLCCQAISKSGIVVFLPKFLEIMFLLSPGTAASLTGVIGTTSGGLATLLAGWAIRKWKMDIPAMLKMIMIAAAIGMVVMLSFFLKCPEPQLVGVSEPYDPSASNIDLKDQCNMGCPCNDMTYDAVCGSDGRVYFDACYAGCTLYNEQSKTFQNCSCLSNDDNVDLLGSATDGACATKTCVNLYIFLAVICVSCACSFIPGPPRQTLTLRCVRHNQRSLALAVQWVMLRCLGTVPGPFLLGSLFDASCILWNTNYDGSQGRCHRYDRTHLSVLLVVVTIGGSTASVVFCVLAYFSHKKIQTKKSENISKVATQTENTMF